jgi:putative SOS response-associated peptidase YedK
MCNDYERNIDWEAFCAAMDVATLKLPAGAGPVDLKTASDTRVSDVAPIVRAAGNSVELVEMRWGFTPPRSGGAPVFNFRSEGRKFANSKRCLIPASAFFEFTGKVSPKSKWRFALSGLPIFAVAGLWREGDNGEKAAFTMLTTIPGPDIVPFHDRQIVVLPPQHWARWLYLDRPEPELLAPLPRGALSVTLTRVGRETPDPLLMKLIA